MTLAAKVLLKPFRYDDHRSSYHIGTVMKGEAKHVVILKLKGELSQKGTDAYYISKKPVKKLPSKKMSALDVAIYRKKTKMQKGVLKVTKKDNFYTFYFKKPNSQNDMIMVTEMVSAVNTRKKLHSMGDTVKFVGKGYSNLNIHLNPVKIYSGGEFFFHFVGDF